MFQKNGLKIDVLIETSISRSKKNEKAREHLKKQKTMDSESVPRFRKACQVSKECHGFDSVSKFQRGLGMGE